MGVISTLWKHFLSILENTKFLTNFILKQITKKNTYQCDNEYADVISTIS